MGQQIPFQTLDDIANGLCKAARTARRAPRTAETVTLGGERLQRLDLAISFDDDREQDVHVSRGVLGPSY